MLLFLFLSLSICPLDFFFFHEMRVTGVWQYVLLLVLPQGLFFHYEPHYLKVTFFFLLGHDFEAIQTFLGDWCKCHFSSLWRILQYPRGSVGNSSCFSSFTSSFLLLGSLYPSSLPCRRCCFSFSQGPHLNFWKYTLNLCPVKYEKFAKPHSNDTFHLWHQNFERKFCSQYFLNWSQILDHPWTHQCLSPIKLIFYLFKNLGSLLHSKI